MAKKNITKILQRGSHKQRAALFFTNRLNENVPNIGKRTLTKEEENALDRSFSAPGGATVFNEYLKVVDNLHVLLVSLESYANGYNKDTLLLNTMLERFIQTHSYRALFSKLKELQNERVNSLTTSIYAPPLARIKEGEFKIKDASHREMLLTAQAMRERSLNTVRTFEIAIYKKLSEYHLEAATSFIALVKSTAEKRKAGESSLAYSILNVSNLIVTEKVAYLRAYSSKEPLLNILQPLLYHSAVIDEPTLNQITKVN